MCVSPFSHLPFPVAPQDRGTNVQSDANSSAIREIRWPQEEGNSRDEDDDGDDEENFPDVVGGEAAERDLMERKE